MKENSGKTHMFLRLRKSGNFIFGQQRLQLYKMLGKWHETFVFDCDFA